MSESNDLTKPYIVDGGYVVKEPVKERITNITGLVGDIVNESYDIYRDARSKGYLDYLNIDNPDITTHVAQVSLVCMAFTKASEGINDNKKDHHFDCNNFELGLSDALYRLHLITGAEIERCGEPLLKFIDKQWFKNHMENYKNRAIGHYNFFKRSTARQYAILKMYNNVAQIIADYRKGRSYEAAMKMIELIVRIRLTGEHERCKNLESIMKKRKNSDFNLSKEDSNLAKHRKNLSNKF